MTVEQLRPLLRAAPFQPFAMLKRPGPLAPCPQKTAMASARRLVAALILLTIVFSASRHAFGEAPVISAGRENWDAPWVPDLRTPGKRISIPPEKRIDVVVLPDGYLAAEAAEFERAVHDWYRRFLTFPAWGEFRGAFRVRGLWTPSEARAAGEQKSHFAVRVAERKVAERQERPGGIARFAAR